ncbi:hypothetical protein BH09PSE1_BH09PSE1_09180 [soil metagenome]
MRPSLLRWPFACLVAATLGASGVSSAIAAEAPAPAVASVAPSASIVSVAPTARQAADAMGMGFNLGQMFENSQHPPTLDVAGPKIDAYYARGFRVVRIPVTWTEPVGDVTLADPATGQVDRTSDRLKALQAVVDYALSKPDLYVVLNAHHETRLKDDNRAEVLEQLWSDIGDIFKARDHRLIFEILNEPHLSDKEPMPAENLRAMTGRAYRKIRAQDARRIVVIGGNQWFGADEMAKTWPDLSEVGGGADPYVMATFHHYDPWTFNGNDQGDYADAWTEANIRNPMQTMADWARTTGAGMPVFIGEWGVGWQSRLPVMNCNNIRLWYSRFQVPNAARMGMPTAVWDDGGWFKIYDYDRKAFDNNLIDCITGPCAWSGPSRFNPDCL